MQPQEVSEEFVIENLPRISGNVQMRALGATSALLRSFLKEIRKKSEELASYGSKAAPPSLNSMVSDKIMKGLSQAVRCDIERVIVVSGVILLALERDKEKVSVLVTAATGYNMFRVLKHSELLLKMVAQQSNGQQCNAWL